MYPFMVASSLVLADIISAATGAVTDIIGAADLGVLAAAGVTLAVGARFVGRFVRSLR